MLSDVRPWKMRRQGKGGEQNQRRFILALQFWNYPSKSRGQKYYISFTCKDTYYWTIFYLPKQITTLVQTFLSNDISRHDDIGIKIHLWVHWQWVPLGTAFWHKLDFFFFPVPLNSGGSLWSIKPSTGSQQAAREGNKYWVCYSLAQRKM